MMIDLVILEAEQMIKIKIFLENEKKEMSIIEIFQKSNREIPSCQENPRSETNKTQTKYSQVIKRPLL